MKYRSQNWELLCNVRQVNGVDKESLCGKTSQKIDGLGLGQLERMELERLRLEVAQLRLSGGHLGN